MGDRAAKDRRGFADDSSDPIDSARLARMFQSMAKRRVRKWIVRDIPAISADDLVSAAWEYVSRYKPKYMGHAVKLGAWGMSAEYWRMRDGRRGHFEDDQPLHIGAWQPDPVFDRPQGDVLPLLDRLTNREAQVAVLTAMGYGPSEIGERLGINEVTVHANTSRARLKVLGETSKRRRGMGSAGAQHGSSSMYTQGCRCPECRRAQADHMRAYRERKRVQRDGADATKGYRR